MDEEQSLFEASADIGCRILLLAERAEERGWQLGFAAALDELESRIVREDAQGIETSQGHHGDDEGRGMTYPAFKKIPRFNREVVITEKIDGTNALVAIWPLGSEPEDLPYRIEINANAWDDPEWVIAAGSRNRWLTPESDNFGFAAWVRDNAEELAKLGPGHHYGEWYGKGIQRGYGLDEKRFALFNSARWTDERPECCDVVPVLYRGNDLRVIPRVLDDLASFGSHVAPWYMRPEGIVIYHTAARQLFKVLLENDNAPKGVAA